MINIKDLSVEQKIKLFKELYADIAKHGKNGDTHLAHINDYERELNTTWWLWYGKR